MTEKVAVVTALATHQRMCIACLAARVGTSTDAANVALTEIAETLIIDRDDHGRCGACGAVGQVVSLYLRPARVSEAHRRDDA